MDYSLPEALLRQTIAVLNEMPAGRVRALLNALDAVIAKQEDERREQARRDLIASFAPEGRVES